MNPPDSQLAEEEWIRNLIHESGRDLLFVWNITTGSFGGPSTASVAFPAAQRNAIAALVAAGCKVGFGDPDSESWRVPNEVLTDGEPDARKILQLLAEQAKEYEFLVFARRS
jgi:hypothetical protein